MVLVSLLLPSFFSPFKCAICSLSSCNEVGIWEGKKKEDKRCRGFLNLSVLNLFLNKFGRACFIYI